MAVEAGVGLRVSGGRSDFGSRGVRGPQVERTERLDKTVHVHLLYSEDAVSVLLSVSVESGSACLALECSIGRKALCRSRYGLRLGAGRR